MAYKYNLDPRANREENLEKAQESTMIEIMDMLNKHQIALMIRPTGFGKTHMMIELAKREKYEKVLYLYPMDVIKQSVYESYHRCDSNGNPIEPSELDGIKFADSEVEHSKYTDLPYIEFCTYSKMLEDYNNPYRFSSDKEWDKLSKEDKASIEKKWNKLSEEKKEALKATWIKRKFEHIELLILDEAHTAGAEGFLSYWDTIHSLTAKGLKSNRLHVLGATATPLRTAQDIDIEKEVFYYTYNGESRSSRITSFDINDCWRFGILKRPYYVKGILNKEKERMNIEKKIGADIKKVLKTIDISEKKLQEDIEDLMAQIKPIQQVIRSSVETIAPYSIENAEYMRLLVFYQNSDDLISNHLEINEAVRNAFEDKGYNSVNPTYITSDIEKIKSQGISISKVKVISDRDSQLREAPESGIGNIDIIHSIDMLNMGYHVGKVTGVIIKRATGSEIRYYQQIGRCMSVGANNQPLIIDLANADAELLGRAYDSGRDLAIQAIKEFVLGCIQDKYQNNAVNQLYKYINMCFDTEDMHEDMIKFWYVDRFAPIYFICAISAALGKKEPKAGLVARIQDLCIKERIDFILDNAFCSKNTRINKKIQEFIGMQSDIVSSNKTKRGGKKNA